MKILIVEDDASKREEIASFLFSLGVPSDDVMVAKDMAEFLGKFCPEVSICIIDLRLPAYDGAENDRNGIGILQAIENASGGRVKLLAISAFPEEFADIRPQFESRGCLLLDFDQKEVWRSVLKQMVIQVQADEVLDFVILCALRKERAPYTGMDFLEGKPRSKDNITRFDISIAGKRGSVIELPRMGLVDAAIGAARCIEKYKPRLICMSGVCAGFDGRAVLGQLLVADMAYEYQSGKWTNDGFSQEPYQVPLNEDVRVLALDMLDDPKLLSRLEEGWSSDRPSKMSDPRLAMFTSGSAVIAAEELMVQVATHHRRVCGLDMEVYAVHRAAQIASCKPDFICAKTVVDLADGEKSDELQPYGCVISAKFIVDFIERYFTSRG